MTLTENITEIEREKQEFELKYSKTVKLIDDILQKEVGLSYGKLYQYPYLFHTLSKEEKKERKQLVKNLLTSNKKN